MYKIVHKMQKGLIDPSGGGLLDLARPCSTLLDPPAGGCSTLLDLARPCSTLLGGGFGGFLVVLLRTEWFCGKSKHFLTFSRGFV